MHSTRNPPTNTQPSSDKICTLHHIPRLSDKIKRLARSMNQNIKFGMKPVKKVGSFFTKLKDKRGMDEKFNIIYSIKCKGCGKKYLGLTRRSWKHRKKEHRNCLKKLEVLKKPNNLSQKEKENLITTALATHAHDTGHDFDISGATTLFESNNWKTLNFLEMVAIQTNDSVNFRSDTDNLNRIYLGILDSLCKRKLI
jgi:predicted GIY-YIG superfamily endonuclease